MLDLSNYPKDLKSFNPGNEKVICKMKDEPQGKINDDFVRLKSKIYSVYGEDECRRCRW